MTDKQDAVEHFRKNMSRIYRQQPISELDFLQLCKEAVELAFLEWQDRDIIANRITQIWLRHKDELSREANLIGDAFADLEVPDEYVLKNDNLTVPELWGKIWHDVDSVLQGR